VQEKATQKILKLDFLRAVSAALVILYHFGVPGVPAGFGVLTFFVISGFLITHLLLRENERTGEISLRKFYMRRSLRIFPAFYAYWILAVADLVYRGRIVWAQAICSFFYVNNYYQGLHGYPSSLLSHTWSLGVEEQFYILWPGVFFLLRKRLPKLVSVLAVAIPGFWVLRAAMHFGGVNEAYIYTALETRIDAILVGCLLAIVLHTGIAAAFIDQVRRPRYLALVLVLLAASFTCGNYFGVAYRNVVAFAVDPVLVALLIAQLITLRAGAWMDSAPLSYLGRISYSTYLYQQIVLPALDKRLPAKLALVGCVAAVWVVAAISYEVIEKPFLKLKRRFEIVRVEDAAGEPVTGEA
jgi:peptidoglycan/LPS O-acetylase OafA/YrhL